MRTDSPDGSGISVIIPTFRRIELLPRVIAAIHAEQPHVDRITVVYRPDDDPATAEWLLQNASTFRNLVPLPVYETGKVAALNLALQSVTGDIVVMLDDDIVVQPGWLATIIRHFDDPRVGAVGGRDIVHSVAGPSTLPRSPTAGLRTWYGRYTGQHDQVEGPPRDVEVLKGCDWAFRRSALGTLRFDARLLGIGAQHGDDYWFVLNLRHAGWRVVLDPAAQVDHYPGYKPDYDQGTLGRKKCYEWTANQIAHNLAFSSPFKKAQYLLHSVLIGVRNCPGMYFFAHTLAKRPRELPGICAGGWAGFVKGWRMADDFTRSPPGVPNPPPR